MNFWDYLKETPDQRRKRQMREALQKLKRKAAPTSHPDDHYAFDGFNKWSEKQRKGKH